MKCPVDGAELKMSDREGVEIDYCPKCRGVWLDRGELDKIIQRSEQGGASDFEDEDENPRGGRNRRRNDRDNDDEEGGFLSNIFGGFGGRDD